MSELRAKVGVGFGNKGKQSRRPVKGERTRLWGEYPHWASLVQLVERRSPKPDVEGSSPSGRDFNKT